MKFFVFIGIAAIAYALSVSVDNLSKVKVIDVNLLLVSTEYFGTNPFIVNVVKVNETYNRITADYWQIKDLPLDTKFRAEVYRSPKSNSKCGTYKKIHEYTVSLCSHDNDKYTAYLPDYFRELKEAGKCLSKAHIQSDNVGYFKFYNLLTNEELENACFKMVVHFSSANVDFYVDELIFVTNDQWKYK